MQYFKPPQPWAVVVDASSFGLMAATTARAFDSGFGCWGWQRRQARHGQQELVRGIEEVQVGVDGSVGSCDENSGLTRVVDGDISFETSAATRLFDDVRGIVGWQQVNPAETDASWFARVIESLLVNKMRRKDVDGLRVRVLCGDGSTVGTEQVLEPNRHVSRGGVEARAACGSVGVGTRAFVAGADEQTATLRSIGKERRVVHVERIESAFSQKGCILLVRCGLESVAEKIEGNIRVEGGGAGSAAKTLIWQPAPASAVVREGEVRCLARRSAQLARKARGVCCEISERDGLDAFGHNGARWSKTLERIVEAHGLVRDEFGEDVSGKDLCERTEPQERVLGGRLMGVRRGLAVSTEKYLIVANDDENHTGRTGLKKEICAERLSGLEVGSRWRRRRLREGWHEGQHERERKQCEQEFRVAHFVVRSQSTKPSDFLKTENAVVRTCVAR
jgi:hypothetical protein